MNLKQLRRGVLENLDKEKFPNRHLQKKMLNPIYTKDQFLISGDV